MKKKPNRVFFTVRDLIEFKSKLEISPINIIVLDTEKSPQTLLDNSDFLNAVKKSILFVAVGKSAAYAENAIDEYFANEANALCNELPPTISVQFWPEAEDIIRTWSIAGDCSVITIAT